MSDLIVDPVISSNPDEARRRYARERFLAFMAEKFWAEKFENEKKTRDGCNHRRIRKNNTTRL